MQAVTPLSRGGRLIYTAGSAAFTMVERLLILYVPFYFWPPEEYALPNLFSSKTYYGFVTILGAAWLVGRVFDGAADPLIASLSDNNRSRVGRRKLFLLLSGLPLALTTALVFFPPRPGSESFLNGIWLGVMLCLFYIFFTAYVNPYLSLLSELGHTEALRIDMSTMMAFMGLLGMICATVLFPLTVGRMQAGGMDFRSSYRVAAVLFAALAAVVLYLVALGFNEKIHCFPVRLKQVGVWESLRKTFAVKPFRIFIMGEVFLQFASNIVTAGMIYYAVVIFRKEQSFMTVLAGVTIIVALISFPLVNRAAKRYGKKKVILTGVGILAACTTAIFFLSFNMSGIYFFLGLAMFGLAGLPLAILSALVNPTIADLARGEALRTGEHREAMFFGARAVPLKLTIALAGVTFAFLLSSFGKDIANPLGVQLSALVVAVSCFIGFLFLMRYPEKEVQERLRRYETSPGAAALDELDPL